MRVVVTRMKNDEEERRKPFRGFVRGIVDTVLRVEWS